MPPSNTKEPPPLRNEVFDRPGREFGFGAILPLGGQGGPRSTPVVRTWVYIW
jgi:hypothetical protein